MKYYILFAIVIAALAYATGRYLQPADVTTQIVEVVKEVEVVKKDVRTVIKEVVRPDGTKETETIIDDKTQTTTEKEQKSETINIVSGSKPQWKVQGQVSLDDISEPSYGIGIERRIIGPVFVGGWANTDKQFGVSVSLEF